MLVKWILVAAVGVEALGQQPVVSFNDSVPGSFALASKHGAPGQILVSANEYWGVVRAAGDLAVDFGRVTGTNLTLSNGAPDARPAEYRYSPVDNRNNTVFRVTGNNTGVFFGPTFADPAPGQTVIIAGTLGHSAVVDALAAASKLGDLSGVAGQWEAFATQLVDAPVPGCARALVIAGSDARGTIFGLYDVSEQIGVSPWHFWADVPAKPVPGAGVYALPTRKVQGTPSVRYRGLFLNDEQPDLTNWVASRWPDTPYGAGYGAGFYALVFEVLLRLRANYLWPAIWASMFNVDDPANQPLADAYEIVMGSSHTEPLMRAQNEFGTFYRGQGPWAYHVNNATIDEYFRYGVQRAKPYARNSLFTMGMRGTGDTAIEGLGTAAIVDMLETLVHRQQAILEEGLGVPVATVPQMWCLYKEVQSYLLAGLDVPDDVTLLWSDDNWGNVRRFPLASERRRAGGAGVYYHFDYVGDPRNYKWINTVQLTKTAEQLGMAYARGADRIWIVNVGDLKGLELPISHFLDMAYDATRWGVEGVDAWTAAWAEREFGGGLVSTPSTQSHRIADLVNRYSLYAARRKYELVEPDTYSVVHYGEADAVLAQWSALVADTEAVYASLPDAVRPAFFETLLHPVLGGALVHRIYISAAYNALWAGQKRTSANAAIDRVLQASDADVALTQRWNALLDGKWVHMMSQTHLGYDGYWQQPMRNTLPALTHVQTAFASLAGEVGIGVEGSNATVPGDDPWHPNSVDALTLPPLDPYGPARRYLDVFSRGTRACTWTANASVPWLHLSQTSGTVDGTMDHDARVWVSVDWARAVAGTVQVHIAHDCVGFERYGFNAPVVHVPVVTRTVPADFAAGFVESDRTVSIEGAHYQSVVAPDSDSSLAYHTFANYGRTGTGVGLVPQDTEKLALHDAPALEYQLYLFSNASGVDGGANVTVYLSPTANYLGDDTPLEYAIALFPAGNDTAMAAAVQHVTPVGDSVGTAYPAGWGHAVANAVWGVTGNYTTSTFALQDAPGAYTLRIWALMPSVIVQKVVIDLGGVRPSYLGPPESFLVGRDTVGANNATSFATVPGVVGPL